MLLQPNRYQHIFAITMINQHAQSLPTKRADFTDAKQHHRKPTQLAPSTSTTSGQFHAGST